MKRLSIILFGLLLIASPALAGGPMSLMMAGGGQSAAAAGTDSHTTPTHTGSGRRNPAPSLRLLLPPAAAGVP